MAARKIAVVGLGYVGLPVAIAFGQKQNVIAFDVNPQRISALKQGIDHTGEVSADDLQKTACTFHADPSSLKEADFFIVAVPTPINQAKQPDFSPLVSASQTIGLSLKKGDIVVYESTVYPGTTEEICGPILEAISGLICGQDFFLAYSPERINPGDRQHTFTQIKKIVSGQTPEIREIVAEVYASVVEAGVYRASSIKVAEAAKVIENTQRDLNIAFVNELAMIFHQLGIDTTEVLQAAGTKWNFLTFQPGLVGGHCIGVDPYYLTYKAESMGYHPQVILAGRRVNDGMGAYIASQTIKLLGQAGMCLSQARIGVLGLTFKENCPDLRNTKVIDLIRELKEYGSQVLVHDPLALPHAAVESYQLQLQAFEDLVNLDVLLLAVAHDFYLQLALTDLVQKLNKNCRIIVDVKSILPLDQLHNQGVTVWRL